MANGVRKDGDAALVILNHDLEAEQPPTVMLIPVTDYKAFIGNFADAQNDGGFDSIKIGQHGTPAFAASWGAYAAVAPKKEFLAKKAEGLKIEGAAAKLMNDKGVDVAVYVNAKALRELALPQLRAHKAEWIAEAEQAVKQEDPKYAPLAKVAVEQGLRFAEEFLQGSTAGGFGLTLGKDGISTTLLGEFEPDSYIGKLVGMVKNTDGSLTAGLPAGEYVFYGGFTQNPAVMEQLMTDFVGPIAKELGALGEGGQKVQEAIDAYKGIVRSMTGASMGFLLDPAGMGQPGGMVKAVSVIEGDSKVILDAQQKVMAMSEELANLMPGPRQTITLKPAAKTIDGVTLNHIQSVIKVDPKKPEEAMAGQFISAMYGTNGINQYIGAVDARHVVQILGDDEALMKAVIASAKANEDVLGGQPQVKGVAAQLPQRRAMAFYLALDKAIAAGMQAAAVFTGGAMKIQLPPNLPPIGVTVSTEGSAVRIDSHTPTQLIQSVVQAVMQAGMRRGGGGGGGGGAPPQGRPGDL